MNEPILQVKDLCTSLQLEGRAVTLVDHFSLNLYRGQTVALVGESGCGKTMTALSLMRILPQPAALPSTGKVIFKGKNLLDLSEKEMRQIRGSRIAMIFQDPASALNPVYTIGNQLMEVAELHLQLYGEEAIECCLKALQEVGIPAPLERFNDYPHQISGGMRQRVMIAMALMCEPDILIADEPTTALDVTIQAQVLDLIRELQERKGMAVLLITHDMGVVAEMANEVIVMYAAQAIERGEAVEIFDHKAHPYTQGLFASRPDLKVPKGSLHPIKGSVPSMTHPPKGCRFHPRCPYVMERCRHGETPIFSIGKENDHEVKCWLYDGSEESALKLAMRN
ncbi:MAG: ABC transporter ATP-binding protein [Parachlamydiaceae bacterium]|nr:ABC transporter ATP-binding protein [Parachlamydiaceae bacterium]